MNVFFTNKFNARTLQKVRSSGGFFRIFSVFSRCKFVCGQTLAKRVVDKLGKETILSGQVPGKNSVEQERSAISELIAKLRILKDGRAVSSEERAITGLLRGLKVWSPKKTTVIGIEYGSDSPEVAQMVVTEVIDAFKFEHARVNRTAGSYEFLREQALLLEKKLLEAQDAMRDAKNETGLVSIE